MKKIMTVLAALFMGAVLAQAETVVSTVNAGKTGTASATCFVEAGTTTAVQLTDVAWVVDATNTSSTINIRTGKKRWAVSSATASGSVIWFDNAGSTVAAQDYIILHDTSAATLYLYKVSAAATTSVTSYTALTAATTTSDYVWSLNTVIQRPACDVLSGTLFTGTLWLPGKEPTALTLDGNTTSCKISVSGVRINN